MTGGDTGEFPEIRRRYLDDLATELESREITTRLLGEGDELILAAIEPGTRRRVLVVAAPSPSGWHYLWPRGGIAAAEEPARAAESIAAALRGSPSGG